MQSKLPSKLVRASRCTVVISNSTQSNWYLAHISNQRKRPISLSSIDMKKTAENTKTATKGVMSAVKAVVGEEPDTFADVDDHPGSLDLPTRKQKINKLLADCERLRALI